MISNLRQELETLIRGGTPLLEIVAELRGLKDHGVSKQEMYETLEALRHQAPDETAEDRILEVMDFVSGFCRSDMRIWQE